MFNNNLITKEPSFFIRQISILNTSIKTKQLIESNIKAVGFVRLDEDGTVDCAPSSCDFYISDNFDYAANTSINAANGGLGFSGSWTQPNGDLATIESGSMSHPGLTSTGNKVRLQSTSDGSTFIRRNLETSIPEDGEFWVSLLVQGDNILNSGFWIQPGGQQPLAFGKKWGQRLSIDNDASSVDMATGTTYWLVVKYETSSTELDKAYLWINPDPTQRPSRLSANVIKTGSLNGTIDYINIGNGSGSNGANYTLDEFRLTCDFPFGGCSIDIQTVSAQSPTNCPSINNGRIAITAIGDDLEYSIDGGNYYQRSNIFSGLANGTYPSIKVRSGAGCIATYGGSIILTKPSCKEVCKNGIDDDGDGLIDNADPDCQSSCSCQEYLYLNEVAGDGSVHKFLIEEDGTLSELQTGGNSWYPGTGISEMNSPHGLATDINGKLYIAERWDGPIRQLDCDGNITPESEFSIPAGAFNMGSIGNILFTNNGSDGGGVVSAYNLCTGDLIRDITFEDNTTTGRGRLWGLYVDPRTEKIYVLFISGALYVFEEGDIYSSLPIPEKFNTGVGLQHGITTDSDGNIYTVRGEGGAYISKFDQNGNLLARSPADLVEEDGFGWARAHAIVYNETNNLLYVSSTSGLEDCISTFNTNLIPQAAAIGPVPGGGGKSMSVLKECCPDATNTVIDKTICNAAVGDVIFLQELVNCDGHVCEGLWVEGVTNKGLSYNSCNNSIEITSTSNISGSFTLSSDGTGNNLQCSAFSITLNIYPCIEVCGNGIDDDEDGTVDCAPSSCDFYISDNFDYAANTSINAANGGLGFSGSWTQPNGDLATIESGSMSHPGLTSTGNKVRLQSTSDGSTFIRRNLETSIPDDGEFWVSLLVQGDNILNSGFWIQPGGQQPLAFGKKWGQRLSIDNDASSVDMATGTTYWLVVKYETSSTELDKAYLWINPDPTQRPSRLSANVIKTGSLNGTIDYINIGNGSGSNGANYTLDEFRLTCDFPFGGCSIDIQTVSAQSPTNCPSINNGRIAITAIGDDLEYSIDGGNYYQRSNIFSGLANGTYPSIKVRSGAGCIATYGGSIILTKPSCKEVCKNGIDDDGDGLIDNADPDCQSSCSCQEYLYLNEVAGDGSVHKFLIEEDGTLSELQTGGNSWYPGTGISEMNSPHGLATDINGKLYIAERWDGPIRQLDCDGNITPESEFSIPAGAFNMGSIGNILFTNNGSDGGGVVSAYNLCTGDLIRDITFEDNTTTGRGRLWGLYVDPRTEKIYVLFISGALYVFEEGDIYSSLPIPEKFNTGVGLQHGITTDSDGNIYTVRGEGGAYISKFDQNGNLLARSPADLVEEDGFGWARAHAIVYNETNNLLYVSSTSGLEDCISTFNTNLIPQAAAIGPVPGGGGKSMSVLKECCPDATNTVIDKTICNAAVGDVIFLQELVNCDGHVCEGLWVEGVTNKGLSYNSCNNSIEITSTSNISGSFTLSSDGTGNNLQCSAFSITLNIYPCIEVCGNGIDDDEDGTVDCAPSSCDFYISDNFDYAANTSINAANGGLGFSGSWTQPNGDLATIESGSMSHPGLTSTGNKVRLQSTSDGSTFIRRNLETSIPDDGEFWVSLLVQGDNILNSGFWIQPGGQQPLAFGKKWGRRLSIDNDASSVDMATGTTYWLVVKYETSSTELDKAYLWINPDPTQRPSRLSANVIKTGSLSGTIDYINIGNGSGSNGANYTLDEFRLTCDFPFGGQSICNISEGVACDDGDNCTDNDVYDANCNCAGTSTTNCIPGLCGSPAIQSVVPENLVDCPVTQFGIITINAIGENLEYSIDGGFSFHSSNVFTGLPKGNYTLQVRNTVSECIFTYDSTISLVGPDCAEDCNNGVDDNGDGIVDCPPVSCNFFLSESFDYNAGTNINATTGGNGFVGNWTEPSGNFTSIESSSLLFPGISSGGNKLRLRPNGNARIIRRDFASPMTEEGVFWISTLIQGDNILSPGFWIQPNGLQTFAIGKSWGENFSIDNNATDISMAEGTTYWLVARYEINNNDLDRVHLWVNPDPTKQPSIIEADATKTGDLSLPISYIQIGLGNGDGANYAIDEFRLTCSYPFGGMPVCNLCYEICDNGIDDDGDGQIDCADGDCSAADINAVNITSPDNCPSLNNGTIIISASGSNLEYSINDGISYQPSNTFLGLTSDTYNIRVRNSATNCEDTYSSTLSLVTCSEICDNGIDDDGDGQIDCADGDCSTYMPIVLNDDSFDACPGFIVERSLSLNDSITNNAIYSLASAPNAGVAIINPNGSFAYTSFSVDCIDDSFIYQVCDTLTGCCAEANVLIDLSDSEAPKLYDIPQDFTVHCDEVIPIPPLVSAEDNCPEIAIELEEISTQGEDGCSLYDFEITRIWTAEDICGNKSLDSQMVKVRDITAPDIFRVYTLPNGKKMVAGVMENVNENWKIISLPIDFTTTPLVFSQIVTTKETTPVSTRIRNISKSQFELKLQEEDGEDGHHIRENVAWIALETGTQSTDYALDARLIDLTDQWNTINFHATYSAIPSFFGMIQTTLDEDPATLRFRNANNNVLQLQIEEETSISANVNHSSEKVAFLSIERDIDLTNNKGDILGETGHLSIDENWVTITTNHTYYNPIVIAGIPEHQDGTPGHAQIRNITPNSFEVRFAEWAYEDGLHSKESISYLVIEGSLPLDASILCDSNTDSLILGKDIIAIDNCDINVTLNYEEETVIDGNAKQIIRTWYAIDECGNATGLSQIVACTGVGLQLKAMLQGAMLSSEEPNLMRDDLRKKGLLPTKEPYSSFKTFDHVGAGGGEECSPSIFAITGNDAIVDWVFIELRSEENQNNIMATCSGLIQRDGDVIAANGDEVLYFENLPPGNYYIKLRHRNHLSVETKYPYLFNGRNVPLIDLTYEFLPTIGNEPFVHMENKNALWSGDLNQSEKIIYQGPNNDIFPMFLQILLDTLNKEYLTNFITHEYTVNDFNLDGKTIFQGPNNDRANLLFNTILKHPENPNAFSNFIISTKDGLNPNDIITCQQDKTQPFCDFDEDGRLNSQDTDDDNDGVIDGNDTNPYNKNSDSDADGISDKDEKELNSDPLNACNPFQNHQNCQGTDLDQDGLFGNYPPDHHLYDKNDMDACIPNSKAGNCGCTDDNNDGYIIICHTSENGQKQTLKITLEQWRLRQGIGDICGACK